VIKDTVTGTSRFIRRFIFLAIMLVVVTFGLSFALLNSDPVTFNFYIGTVELELSVLLVITFAVGALLGVFTSFGIILRSKHQVSKIKREIKKEMKNSNKNFNNMQVASVKEM